ncbi:Cytochrome c oxidase subunit 5A, partial [Ascosphaera atra]
AVSTATGPLARLGLRQPSSRLASTVAPSSAHADVAIAAPSLANIEKRWESMPPQEQADLYMALRDRMKNDWHNLTLKEKQAAYWISFGPHGPRAETPKGEGWKQLYHVSWYLGITLLVFLGIRSFANPPPKTMSKEWQEMTNEYAKKEKINPIHGISSEGYEGKGYVQSK